MRERRDPAVETSVVAALGARAAALLRGGVPAAALWRTLAAEGRKTRGDPSGSVLGPRTRGPAIAAGVAVAAADIARAVDDGTGVAAALAARPRAPWRVLAAAWLLSERSGAPLAPVLERVAEACRELAKIAERRAVLHAGPRATVRLVLALPALASGMGALLGFNPIAVLMSGPGIGLLIVGIALMCTGVMWTRALQRRAERDDAVTGLECELLWVALGGGTAPALARLRTADAVDEVGAEWIPLDRFCRDELLDTVVASAEDTGAALGPLLLTEGRAARERAAAELERGAERFGVQILLPLGLCVLPAFIAIGVAPVILAMLAGV